MWLAPIRELPARVGGDHAWHSLLLRGSVKVRLLVCGCSVGRIRQAAQENICSPLLTPQAENFHAWRELELRISGKAAVKRASGAELHRCTKIDPDLQTNLMALSSQSSWPWVRASLHTVYNQLGAVQLPPNMTG
jgi:hypothetical protein